MKKRNELDDVLELLRREQDLAGDEPLQLVLRVGPDGLELASRASGEPDLGTILPRQFEIAVVPGPETIQ